MAVQFILGRAGSGKTRLAYARLADLCRQDPLGPPAFLIVPRQATFQAERDFACGDALPGGPLPGFCRLRVVSFDFLGQMVLDECGDAALPLVTPAGRRMILGHLLRREAEHLQFFRPSARRAGLPAALDAAFADVERSGTSVADFSATAERALSEAGGTDAETVDAAAVAKLADLARLYAAYEAYLGQDRLDPHRRETRVLDAVESCPSVRGATVVIDGFYDFAPAERDVIVRLARSAGSVTVTLPVDPDSPVVSAGATPDDGGAFRRPEAAYVKLAAALRDRGIAVTHAEAAGATHATDRRFAAPALASLERAFAHPRVSPADDPAGGGAVSLVEASDRRAEVDAAARQILAWRDAGLRLRDVAVLVRDADEYADLIDASFAEHGIPYFADRRRPGAHHPLVRFTRAAVACALREWPADAAVALLKTGLAGGSADAAEAVENHALRRRLSGPAAWATPWPDVAADLPGDCGSGDETGCVDAARQKLFDGLSPLSAALSPPDVTYREAASAVCAAFEAFGVRQTLATWAHDAVAAGDLLAAEEHQQAWAEVSGLFAQMVDLLGDERVAPAEFAEVLEQGLESFDLAVVPPTVDQVLVGTPDRTRTPAGLRACVVMGLNDGQFPRAARGESILADGERRYFESQGLELAPDGRRALLDEQFLGYLALTRASDFLCLTRPLADGDARAGPSAFWTRVRDLFPAARVATPPARAEDDPATIATPRQLVTAVMGWARADPAEPANATNAPVLAALYDRLAAHPATAGDAVAEARFRAWPALSYDNAAALSPDLARKLFGDSLAVRQVERFAECPFRHFAYHGLGLRARDGDAAPQVNAQRAFEDALDRLVGEVLRDGVDWADDSADLGPAVERHVAAVVKALADAVPNRTGRDRYLVERLTATLAAAVEGQRAAARAGGYRPRWNRLGYGRPGSKLGEFRVDTPAGRSVSLRGSVDRVDATDAGDVAAVDYRLGGGAMDYAAAWHGLRLELLTALRVVEARAGALPGAPNGGALRASAALQLRVLRSTVGKDSRTEALGIAESSLLLRDKPRGVFREGAAGDLDPACPDGKASDVVHLKLNLNGAISYPNSDAVTDAAFDGLLARTAERLGTLSDRLLDGRVAVAPYRIGDRSPCPTCDYLAVCRFDPASGDERPLASMSAKAVAAAAETFDPSAEPDGGDS